MTDKDIDSGSHDRRTVLKALGVGGLAATGLGAATGSAAAQNKKTVAEITNAQDLVQEGGQVGSGLLVVQVQNVNVSDVLDAAIAVGDDVIDVDVGDITVLSNNNVEIVVNDTVDVVGNTVQVAVTLLGTTAQDATNDLFAVGDTTSISL